MVTHHAVDVQLEGGVVVRSRLVQMNEEEEVRPLVVFLLDVLLETLATTTTTTCHVSEEWSMKSQDHVSLTPPPCSKS